MTPQQEILIRTLCYSDVFDYPLNSKELKNYELRITRPHRQGSTADYESEAKTDSTNHIQPQGGYYFLKGREKIVKIRKKREEYSREKLRRAKHLSQFFTLIPTIKLLAITGAVAAGNARKEDDIDVLVISSRGKLWTTRLFVILFAEVLGVRRRPSSRHANDKLCFNMFMDEDNLSIPKNERDLFSANEVARVKILWERGKVAQRFWHANAWISQYLPSYERRSKQSHTALWDIQGVSHTEAYGVIEALFKWLQLHYMQSRRTNEIVKNGYLRFHPRDARVWIMKEYQRRLKKYGLE